MGTKVTELRARIARTRRNRRGHRMYDDRLRQEIVEYARSRVGEGVPQVRVAKELRIGNRLVWAWLRAGTDPPAVRAVKIAPEAKRATEPRRIPTARAKLVAGAEARSQVAVVLPSGVRIEGLAVEEALSVVRALA